MRKERNLTGGYIQYILTINGITEDKIMDKKGAFYWIHFIPEHATTLKYIVTCDTGISKIFETFLEARTWCKFSGKSFYDNVNHKLYA